MLQNIVTLATNKPNYGMLQSPTSGSQRPTAGLRIENQQSLAKVGSLWRQGRQQNRGRSEVTKEVQAGMRAATGRKQLVAIHLHRKLRMQLQELQVKSQGCGTQQWTTESFPFILWRVTQKTFRKQPRHQHPQCL